MAVNHVITGPLAADLFIADMLLLGIEEGHLPAPDPRVAMMLQRIPRPAIEHAVSVLIDHLDECDGDPDLESDGDELDGTCAEDEAGAELYARPWSGPGCEISDPDKGDEEDGEREEGR